MQIKELAARSGLSPRTIRYYEQVGVLPPPRRLPNGYRDYDESDLERVRFVIGARRLGFSLDDIAEILAMRDRREAPCVVVLSLLQRKADEIAERIRELQQLETELHQLYELGRTFPTDDVDAKDCVCHLVQTRS